MQKKCVFLDRDGTIIVDKIYLNDPDQIEYLPGVETALKMLRNAGYCFVVATNQSGVPRGIVTVENLDEIHRRIRAHFAKNGVDILSFHSAPFMTDTDHWMRKPNPGMLLEGSKFHNIDAPKSWMIGDKMTDVEAGHRAGMQSILLATSGKDTPEDSDFDPPEAFVPDLLTAAEYILSCGEEDEEVLDWE